MTAGFLPIAEAARFVGRSPRWIRRRLGEIAHYRPPDGQLLFRAADLDSYLAQFRVDPVKAAVKPDLDEILADIDSTSRRRRGKK